MQPTVISLFSGVGGMDLGFIKAGFKVIWGIDINKDSCLSHEDWSETEIINGDIRNINIKDIPDSDVIVGSLPISVYSKAYDRISGDKKDYIDIVIDIIEFKRPKAFLLEVHKSNLKSELFNNNILKLNSVGYDIAYKVLNTKDYSIAQHKERLILVGYKKGLSSFFQFPKVHSKLVTVREVIKDLDSIDPKDRKFISENTLQRSLSRWNGIKILDLDGLSPSINGITKLIREDLYQQFGKHCTIAWQEAAAIQSFPRHIYFYGSLNSKFKQIANAFPPQLAYYLALELLPFMTTDNTLLDIEVPFKNRSDSVSANHIYKSSTSYHQDAQLEQQELSVVNNLEEINDNLTEAECLIKRIKSLTVGSEKADDYHKLIFHCLSYIFAESFKRGRCEARLNNGRKRVDIVFDNFATTGFFAHVKDSYQVFCPRILIECKNYSSDPSNPELDQLLGRLGDRTGKLGILICREVKDTDKLMNRCKDALYQSSSYVFFLTDKDIIELLKLKEASDEEAILEYLSLLWDQLTLNN